MRNVVSLRVAAARGGEVPAGPASPQADLALTPGRIEVSAEGVTDAKRETEHGQQKPDVK
jgi:hypothetical protein